MIGFYSGIFSRDEESILCYLNHQKHISILPTFLDMVKNVSFYFTCKVKN